MKSSPLLLRGGTLLCHGLNDEVEALWNTDLLVLNGRISSIAKDIPAPAGGQVIDCHDKIICPGFIDTHHHVWQTQLKGRHSDDTLLDYTPKGNMQCYNYSPSDIFWGELAGCLEAIDAGTTCVVDHAHMTYSTDHALAGLSAALTSNIRSVFCYSIIPRVKRWDSEVEPVADPIPSWSISQFRELAARQPFGNGRITIGLGFDMLNLPKDQVIDLFQTARKLKVKTITSHWRKNNIAGSGKSIPRILQDYSLLGKDILLSHATGTEEADFKLLWDAGAFVSCTPATESQMAHGEIVGFRSDVHGSLGADCHSANSTSMLHAMRTGLAVARSHRNNRVLSSGKFPRRVEPTTSQAFNLATISGARAIGMEEEIGSLAVGKRADLIVFNADSPAMACAAEENPLVAVVRHASTREVEMVIIDGSIRKRGGRLEDMSLDTEIEPWSGSSEVASCCVSGTQIDWATTRKMLLQSRQDILARIRACSLPQARAATLQQWGTADAEDLFV